MSTWHTDSNPTHYHFLSPDEGYDYELRIRIQGKAMTRISFKSKSGMSSDYEAKSGAML
jgi:hypothetical protein